MRKISILFLLVVCAVSFGRAEMKILVEGLPPVDFDQDTLSLPPAYFPEMPAQLRAWLEERGYRIPQVHDERIATFADGCFKKFDKYNAVGGDFNGIGEKDWVVVTFRNDSLSAFICWDSNVASIEQLDISEFGSKGYSRFSVYDVSCTSFFIVLAKVKKEWLNGDPIDGPTPTAGENEKLPSHITHDGFVCESDGDIWEGGYVRYFHNGEWLRFYHFGSTIATMDTLCLQKLYGPRQCF